ncbi:MAG: HlyD family type I secretion periplasmic adaptor subunit [Pseudomonadota bacterium]
MHQGNSSAISALPEIRSLIFTGITIILVFFVGLGSWAAVAPLQSAAIAPGVLNVESNRKTIQHLEGGIVAELLVSEGQEVVAGEVLLKLDATQAGANLAQLKNRYVALKVQEARLLAERDGAEEISFENLSGFLNAEEAKAAEIRVFEARRKAIQGEKNILEKRISQFKEEMAGLGGQIRAQSAELKLIAEELEAQQSLFEKKLAGKQRIITLKREKSELLGDRNQQQAAVARIKQNIGEEQLKIIELRTNRINEVVAQLTEVQTALADIDERLVAAEDIHTRTDIIAPLDGTIVDLKIHTVGGVVGPGEALMDIVPTKAQLIVHGRVNPIDIDAINVGMQAQVVLTAFNRRTVAPAKGEVVSISADRLTDPRSGVPYYLARVKLDEEFVSDNDSLSLSAGMQAEVMIITGEQTPIEYLFKPVVRSFYRAMRED